MRACSIAFFAFLILAAQPSWSQKKVTKTVVKKEYNFKAIGATMPNFVIRNYNSKLISNKDTKRFDHVMLVLFSPNCDHCVDFTKNLVLHSNEFKDVGIVFVSSQGLDEFLDKFIEESGIRKELKGNIFIGTDQTRIANNSSGYSEFLYQMYSFKLPQVYLYNKENKLMYQALGEISVEDIGKELRK